MKMDDLDLQIKYTPAERQFLLYEYFQRHTNKSHPVSRKEIMDYLETFEIYISPNTLYYIFSKKQRDFAIESFLLLLRLGSRRGQKEVYKTELH